MSNTVDLYQEELKERLASVRWERRANILCSVVFVMIFVLLSIQIGKEIVRTTVNQDGEPKKLILRSVLPEYENESR